MQDMSKIMVGLTYGDTGFVPAKLPDEVLDYGAYTNVAVIHSVPDINASVLVTPEDYINWARFFAEQKIYFSLIYTQADAELMGMKTLLDADTVQKMYEVAGDYFMGDNLGEIGNATIMSNDSHDKFDDMQKAKEHFVGIMRKRVELDREMGVKCISNVESHMVMRYGLEAGMDMGNCELFPGNVDHNLAFTRGATKGFRRELFGAYIAHMWYAGMRNDDPLKFYRLKLMYNQAYMAGAGQIILESGIERVNSYGADYKKEDAHCQAIADVAYSFYEFTKRDKRLARGPIVKVAFVGGNLDSFGGTSMGNGGICPSAVWGQHDKEAWAYGAPEASYRILDEVFRSCDWHDTVNYGDYDFSHAPAYGQYDVLPCEAPVEVMREYDWLIFTGWNTMTEELYEKLKAYVQAGGKLLISAAHLRTTARKDEKGSYLRDGKLADLLGCDLTGNTIRSKDGFKFERESDIEGLLYPGTKDYRCDPVGCFGYTDYAELKLTTGNRKAFFARKFRDEGYDDSPAVVVENACGKGHVLFMATEEYPGSADVYTLYKLLVKEVLTATHRLCDIKVVCNDKVRFAVYEDDENYKVYLLNTDMNVDQKVRIFYQNQSFEETIESLNMQSVLFAK